MLHHPRPGGDTSLGAFRPGKKEALGGRDTVLETQGNEQVKSGGVSSERCSQALGRAAGRWENKGLTLLESSAVSKALCLQTQKTMGQGTDIRNQPIEGVPGRLKSERRQQAQTVSVSLKATSGKDEGA